MAASRGAGAERRRTAARPHGSTSSTDREARARGRAESPPATALQCRIAASSPPNLPRPPAHLCCCLRASSSAAVCSAPPTSPQPLREPLRSGSEQQGRSGARRRRPTRSLMTKAAEEPGGAHWLDLASVHGAPEAEQRPACTPARLRHALQHLLPRPALNPLSRPHTRLFPAAQPTSIQHWQLRDLVQADDRYVYTVNGPRVQRLKLATGKARCCCAVQCRVARREVTRRCAAGGDVCDVPPCSVWAGADIARSARQLPGNRHRERAGVRPLAASPLHVCSRGI